MFSDSQFSYLTIDVVLARPPSLALKSYTLHPHPKEQTFLWNYLTSFQFSCSRDDSVAIFLFSCFFYPFRTTSCLCSTTENRMFRSHLFLCDVVSHHFNFVDLTVRLETILLLFFSLDVFTHFIPRIVSVLLHRTECSVPICSSVVLSHIFSI